VRVDSPEWNRLRYSLYAPFYDRLVAWLPAFARGRRRSLEMAALRPGERVLLVAAGTGLDLDHLPPDVEVAAADITPAMIARLRERARRLGRAVDARVMDAARLEYPDGAFDCVVLHLALAVVPNPVAALREAVRVLAPGGRVAVFDKFLPDGARASLARRAFSAVARVVATDFNRRLGELARAGGLRVARREPVAFGGTFVAARLERV
jgi:phosphatidylethanolamine/phosphatidyl-N-methylethanolamine N-methyltransferase